MKDDSLPAETSAALWSALRSGRALTAREAAGEGLGAEPYIRRLLRAWTEARVLSWELDGAGRTLAKRYAVRPDAPTAPPVVRKDGTTAPRDGYMSASEFAATRRLLGLSLCGFGRLLGRTGSQPTVTREMRRYEENRPISESLAAQVRALRSSIVHVGLAQDAETGGWYAASEDRADVYVEGPTSAAVEAGFRAVLAASGDTVQVVVADPVSRNAKKPAPDPKAEGGL
jgi:hypothetical protein